MKNIIAIASLIAAGTALANAETINWTELSFSLITIASNGNRSSCTDPLTSGNTGFSWEGQTTLDNWKLEFTLKDASTGPTTNSRIFSTRSVAQTADGNVQCSTKWQLYFSEVGKLNFGYNSGNAAPTSSLLSDTDGLSYTSGSKVTLQFVKNADGSSGTFTLTVGNASSTATVNDNLVTATFMPTLSSSGGNISRIWTNSGKSTFSNIKLYSGTVIPEPSMFGLLAGVGALAFVAARRRRCRAK